MKASGLVEQRRSAASFRFAAVAGLVLSVTGCSVAPETRAVYVPSAITLAKVRLDPVAATAKLNAYRAEKGLNPLRLDSTLTAMADRQAQAMAQSGTMSHDVAGSLSARLAASGINAPTGENLGAGYMSFDEVLAGWRASAGHDANLAHARRDPIWHCAREKPERRLRSLLGNGSGRRTAKRGCTGSEVAVSAAYRGHRAPVERLSEERVLISSVGGRGGDVAALARVAAVFESEGRIAPWRWRGR